MNNNRMLLTSYGNWNLVKCLGAGAFGEVHHWKHTITGQEIATKRLKPNPQLKPDEIKMLQKRWCQESEWMKTLTTECIVAAVFVDDDFLQYLIRQSHVEHNLPVIVMEYCNGGDLRSHLNRIENMNGLIEYEVRLILYTLYNAIQYLHSKCNIEHRDIKPENIVLHIEGNKKVYKLADFGYAREIPDSTIAQSVVGTRNYVAPEVVTSGSYTQSVDYWSAGHVAYEIICGTIPFLPYADDFTKRIQAIKSKTKNCINIEQKVESSNNDGEIEYGYELPLNHCSPIFNQQITKWLSLSLDNDYKTRGRDSQNNLKFFSVLNDILKNNEILTVFSLKKYKKFYYDIKTFKNLIEFVETLSEDNGIHKNNFFPIKPPLHPNEIIKEPSDYFVAEWCDTSNPENPPVMLYVNEYVQHEPSSHIDIEKHFMPYKMIIIKLMATNPRDQNIPLWLLQQFEKKVHLMLTTEQNHLKCYMMGLQGYIMEIEKYVFYYEKHVTDLNDKIYSLQGSIQLFSTVTDEIIKCQNSQLKESTELRIRNFMTKAHELIKINNEIIKKTYKLLLQNCRELAHPDFYTKIIADDIFLLKDYRRFLTQVNGQKEERIAKAQECFNNCIQKIETFFNGKESMIKKRVADIDREVCAFNRLQVTVIEMNRDIDSVVREIEKETRSLLKDSITNNALSSQMHSLNVDGNTSNVLLNSTNILNGPSMDSMNLISETLELIDMMNYTMNYSP